MLEVTLLSRKDLVCFAASVYIGGCEVFICSGASSCRSLHSQLRIMGVQGGISLALLLTSIFGTVLTVLAPVGYSNCSRGVRREPVVLMFHVEHDVFGGVPGR